MVFDGESDVLLGFADQPGKLRFEVLRGQYPQGAFQLGSVLAEANVAQEVERLAMAVSQRFELVHKLPQADSQRLALLAIPEK